MPIFRSKPREIKAMKYDGTNYWKVWEYFGKPENLWEIHFASAPPHMMLQTTHGDLQKCMPGEWVVQDAQDDPSFRPLPERELFHDFYEKSPPAWKGEY